MVVFIGIGLVGSHLMFLIGIAHLCSAIFPVGGLTIFLILAVLSGFGMLHIQTMLEGYFISRHIKKRPNSGWRVVAQKRDSEIKRKTRWARIVSSPARN